MKKEKFIYNKQTLRYEKVVEPLRVKLFRVFALISAVLVFSFIIVAFAYSYLDSPKEKALRLEIEQMKSQYKLINEQVGFYEKVIDNIQDRDKSVHRMIFGMNPIDDDIWNGGTGGSKRLEYLSRYKNTGELMIEANEKIERLGRKLVTQSKSLDEVTEVAKDWDKRFASLPSIKPVREDKLKKSISLLSGFGARMHPIHRIVKMHQGMDFTSPIGTPVYASGDGVIKEVEYQNGGYGNHIIIDHGYGYETLYAHLSKAKVTQGQKITKGQFIGNVGSTGLSTGPHLHYEVHYKGQPVNPIHFCMDGLTTEEYKNLVDAASTSNQSFD